MAVFGTEARDDAARDALAMIRAAAADDIEAAAILSVHLSDAGLTAAILARWFVEAARETDINLPAALDLYQQDTGL